MPLKVNKMFIKKALMPARSKFGFSSFLDAFARDANSNHVSTGADRLRLFGAHEIAICSALASPFDNQVCGSAKSGNRCVFEDLRDAASAISIRDCALVSAVLLRNNPKLISGSKGSLLCLTSRILVL